MRRPEFEIEGSFEAGCRRYVVARIIGDSVDFDLSSSSMLGGCRVERWLDVPRALDANGKQRFDLFGFCLANADDASRLNVGQRVSLS